MSRRDTGDAPTTFEDGRLLEVHCDAGSLRAVIEEVVSPLIAQAIA